MNSAAKILPILATVLLAAGPLLAQQDEAYGDDYEPGDYARVRYHENGVLILRADQKPGASGASDVNAPVLPGDTVVTGVDQRVELQLAGGTVIRMDRASRLAILALPSPYSKLEDSAVLQLVEGTIRIAARLDEGLEFRVDTPSAAVYILSTDGDFRIEAALDGRTLVSSWRGVAEVVSEGGSVLVRAGTRAEAYPGSVPGEARPFNTFIADSFDRWVGERMELYLVRDRYGNTYEEEDDAYAGDQDVYEALPDEVQPYYTELSNAGSWVYASGYGYGWYPSGVYSGWRPYYDGYWHYGRRGYFWVSHERWGWAPYHYGRWSWLSGYGWCWFPGRVFAGAWVSWSWGSAYIGWAPLGYYNYPAYVGTIYHGYYDPLSWTFLHYKHFGHRKFHDHAVPADHIVEDIGGNAVVTRAPRVAPRDVAEDPEQRGRAARLARNNPGTRVARIDRPNQPRTRFTDGEERVARRLGTGRATRDAERPGAAEARPLGRARPENPSRAGSLSTGPSARSPRATRRLAFDRSADPAPQGERRRVTSADPPRRSGAGARARTSLDTESQRRNLYRDVARPRATVRDTSGPGRSGPPTTAGRRATGSAAPRATPRSSGSRGSSRPTATPRSSGSRGSSRPTAAPRRSGSRGSSRQTATPRSSGSRGSSRQTAAPRRSGSGSPRAAQQSSPSRSSRSSPRASSRSSAPRPRASASSPSRRSSPGRSSASPSRSSRSSSTVGKSAAKSGKSSRGKSGSSRKK